MEIEKAEYEMQVVQPLGSIDDAKLAMTAYQTLCRQLLDESDYQTISGKSFVTRSGWRKLAVNYGISFKIMDRTFLRDDNGRLISAEFIVRATAPNGRYAEGWGACSSEERRHGNKVGHDVPATAETRAKNRACADLFGMGDVTAEEAEEAPELVAVPGAPQETIDEIQARIDTLSDDDRDELKQWWQRNELKPLSVIDIDEAESVDKYLDVLKGNF